MPPETAPMPPKVIYYYYYYVYTLKKHHINTEKIQVGIGQREEDDYIVEQK